MILSHVCVLIVIENVKLDSILFEIISGLWPYFTCADVGAVVGGVIGAVVILAVIAAVVVFILMKRR